MGSRFPVVLRNYWKLLRFFTKREPTLSPQGSHHHLEDIWRRVNGEYFEGKLSLKITWFTKRKSNHQRRIVLGSYHFRRQTIRISSYLDQAHIPDYFVSYIVFHEALHHVYPPVRGKRGKRSIHHAAFKTHEKKFKHYALAKEFSAQVRKELFSNTISEK